MKLPFMRPPHSESHEKVNRALGPGRFVHPASPSRGYLSK
jgi:hypothetical protein